MKLDLIELTKENVPDKVVVCFDRLRNVMFGYVRKADHYFYCDFPYFHDMTLRDITHFAHIPNLSQEIETVNPNQPLIDEYRGLIERRQMQITQIERQFGTKRLSSEFDELNNDKIKFETQLTDYQQFITKLEGRND